MTTTGASSKQQLVVNPEYANLVPKISKAQYKSIRQDIGENGQHVPIIINRKGEILDGHTRFSINQELVKETRTELCPEMYEDPLFAKQFIININRNRRQLNAFQRIELQYKLEPIEAELAKRRQLKLAGTRPNKQTLSKNLPKVGIDFDPESETLGRVIDIAAAKAHVSSETYRRGRELIRKESPEIIEKLRTEKLKIHKVYMRRVKQEKRQQLLEESRINNRELPYGCKLLLGDCIEVSKQIPDNSIDLIFTDPPYDKASLYVYEYLGKIAMRF